MKAGILSVLVLASTIPLILAEDPPGFVHWTSGQLKGFDQKLAAKINPQKVASEQLGNFGNHSFMVAHRQGDGLAEVHENQADVFIVQSGDATLVVGGKLVDGKTTGPGELRGPSIEGGEKKKLGAGDVVHIPARVAHQLLVAGGTRFNYAVVKIDTK